MTFCCKEKHTCSEPLKIWSPVIENNLSKQFPKQRSILPLLAVSPCTCRGSTIHEVKCKRDTIYHIVVTYPVLLNCFVP